MELEQQAVIPPTESWALPVYESHAGGCSQTSSRSAFTFFEIAISIALATFCVLTVMALIPAGLKMQQKARFELLASTKACELIELFGGKPSEERIAEFETPEPWESRPWCYSGTRWDFETRTSRWDTGIMPVPLDIANRLDSDNDEIHSLLSQGAYLYYADPRSIPSVDTMFVNPMPTNDGLKLIFAVTGYAQDNAIQVFNYKAWPYRCAYPSPPMVSWYNGQAFFPCNYNSSSSPYISSEGWVNGSPDAIQPTAYDPLMVTLNQAALSFQLNTALYLGVYDRTNAIAQWQGPLQTAVTNYVADKFNNGIISGAMGSLPVSGLNVSAEYKTYYLASGQPDNGFHALAQSYAADFSALCEKAEPTGENYNTQVIEGKAKLRAEIAMRVQCMRFLSMLASTYYINNSSQTGQTWDPTNLTNIPMANQPFAPDILTLNRLRYYEDCAKTLSMRYAASFTYDWGAPRPCARAIMMDYPLIEYDMFSPPHSGTIVGSGGVAAAQWCPISGQTITSIGMPYSFPGILTNGVFDNQHSPFVPFDGPNRTPNPPNIWGNASHFTLTRPFQAAERCRQLVFWSVDWQSYEDAETAPSAPLDASRCPLNGLNSGWLTGSYVGRIQNTGLPYQDGLEYRNPERQLNFIQDVSGFPTGTSLYSPQLVELGGGADGGGNVGVLDGIYGADRNHNFVLDRGPIKKSQRMHAQLVARFNFYDPRIPVTLR